MSPSKRWGAVSASFVAGALALSLVGCSSGSSSTDTDAESGDASASTGEQQVVTFWQFDTYEASIEAYNQAIEEFEKQNPDIKIDMQIVPWSDQQQKLATAIAGDSLPDVSMMGNNVVAQYATAGYLHPLDEWIDEWSEEEGRNVVEDWFPGDQDYYTIDGSYYASPLAAESRMLLINGALFEEAGLDPNDPPTTWDEMIETAKVLQEKTDVVPWSAPMSNAYITLQTFMSVYLSYGAELFNEEGKCGLDTQEFKDALTMYTSVGLDGLSAPDAANMTQENASDLFLTGRAAMYIDGPSVITAAMNEGGELAENLVVAEIPSGPEGQFGFLGGWPLVMWEGTDVPDAAAKWIHFVTSPDGALNQIAETSGILPARISATEQSPWNEEPMSLVAAQLQNAYPYQYPAAPSAKMGVIETSSIQTAVQEVATGVKTVDEATVSLCENINDILDD